MRIVKDGLLDSFVKPTSEGGWGLCDWIVSIMTESRAYSADQIYTAIQESELSASIKALSKTHISTVLEYMCDKVFSGITILESESATISYEPASEPHAYAGWDLSGASPFTMNGNTPVSGSGKWVIFSGDGGSFDDDTLPNAQFTGAASTTYVLMWILNQNNSLTIDKITVTVT